MLRVATQVIIYLGQRSHVASRCQPTYSDKLSSSACLFGISARKVYPYNWLPSYTVVSYTTFSPLPTAYLSVGCRRLFSVALSVTRCYTNAYPLGSALLFAVRTFLRHIFCAAITRHCSSANVNSVGHILAF